MPFKAKSKRAKRARMLLSPRAGLTVQSSQIVAPRQKTVLRYAEYVSLDPGVGTAAGYVFSANGMYDPNVSGTGHQPLGYDQWTTFYDHYTVESSTIKVHFTSNGSTTTQQSGVVGISIRDVSTSLTGSDVTALVEQGTLGFNRYEVLGISNSAPTTVVTNSYSAHMFFGVKDVLDSAVLRGDVSAQPTDQAYYHVWYAPISGGLDLSACIALVEIEYTVYFTEPRVLSQS